MSPALAAPDSISDAYNRVYAQASRSEHSEAATRHLAEYHQAKVSVGDRVGVIETEFTEPVCYKVGSKDGNANCTEGAQ